MKSMVGKNLKIIIITERKLWCVPIIYHTPSPDYRKNRDVPNVHQESLVRNMFTRDSRKVLYIPKEPTLGTDTETWINGLKCDIKSTKDLQYHYDGTSEGAQSKQVDRADLKKNSKK